ncbi:unnamed protein product [Clonostachys solani]|uniref:polynucleotide adenylyltransferase n=1 Tax=Clonostachys solani TaxID=160281 RepID=A0A9N9ZHX7_9HYPO|nr:unnamed protein product [Clonostachys solani]
MAPADQTAKSALLTPSTDTALCLIPPKHLWEPVDRLRSLYDKAYNRWPPHVNLVYPFVQPDCLERAAEAIAQIDYGLELGQSTPLAALSEPDVFAQKNNNTIHLRPRNGQNLELLRRLSNMLQHALGRSEDQNFKPHMTVAQSQDRNSASHLYLVDKIRSIGDISWDVTELAILIRDKDVSSTDPTAPRPMKVWGRVSLNPIQINRLPTPETIYSQNEEVQSSALPQPAPQTTYTFCSSESKWVSHSCSITSAPKQPTMDRLIVASYNVLGEFEWPPNQDRYPNIVENLISDRGRADILALQEVTDHFLQFLLADERIRSQYPFSTHGPPDQLDVGPLPNHLNIVILSKFEFQWNNLSLPRKHKGSPILTFPSVRESDTESSNSQALPLVLAACHLSHGLVDGAVASKKNELQRILNHLTSTYQFHPWIIAGDFNIATSSYTIETARQRRFISSQSYRYLREFTFKLTESGLQDTWIASRIQSGESSTQSWRLEPTADELFEGEEGATFDPQSNILAAKLVGSGMNNRPQRYDRILVNSHFRLRPSRFNMFGLPPTQVQADEQMDAGASDHWGVRCLFQAPSQEEKSQESAREKAMDVKLERGPSSLGGLEDLKRCLQKRDFLPTQANVADRQHAINLLQTTLQCQAAGQDMPEDGKGLQLTLVPVGSFGLGVWTESSDVDVLCIGGISSKLFFKLAISRLRKAESSGITILRRVRASSGTMLLLDISGIKFDLHYCGSLSILEQFPEVMKRPPTDPAFALPPQTLSKLKPVRDLFYIRRSIPDMSQYRAAHLLIKAWAKSRGLYGAKFGLLGGINIAVTLVPVCKALVKKVGSVSVADIVVSYFHHYAQFDWKTQVVFDPFFHKNLTYRRSSTEPLCLLGWHPPVLNTALNASMPTVKTIQAEISRSCELLSSPNITWDKFLDSFMGPSSLGELALDPGAADFLETFKVYARLDISYWGSSSRKRNDFVGWLESRCVMLLVEIGRKAPGFTARIWPQRFVDGGAVKASGSEETSDYNGCYLLGIERESRDHSEGALQATLAQFEQRIRGDARHFDANTSWMAATLVKCTELGDLQLDKSLFLEDNVGAADDDISSDDEESDEDEEIDDEDGLAKLPIRQQPQHGLGLSTAKLRTAVDVMNRLRWDPHMDSDDYIVGYEDRFTGTCEKSLEMWKTDQTDEEFIPQHRILYFKRRSDNELVWERRTRIDKIFGSGASSQPEPGYE